MNVIRVDFENGKRFDAPDPELDTPLTEVQVEAEAILLELGRGRLNGNQMADVLRAFRTGELPDEMPDPAMSGDRGVFLPVFAKLLHEADHGR